MFIEQRATNNIYYYFIAWETALGNRGFLYGQGALTY